MNYKIYLGTVEFDIHCPKNINWTDAEKNFFKPTVSSKISIKITVTFCENLHEPFGHKLYSNYIMDIYKSPHKELRYYHTNMSKQKSLMASAIYENQKIDLRINHLWKNSELSLLMMIFIEKILLEQSGLILHCSYIKSSQGAILFTAPSGTGKTTQASIWNRIYKTQIINGDRCLIQKNNENFLANGFFYHGTSLECENKSMPIRAIIVIRQSDSDYIEELSFKQKILLLFSECTINSWDEKSINQAFDLLELFVKQTPVIMLHCTMKDNSAIVLNDYLNEMERNNGTI